MVVARLKHSTAHEKYALARCRHSTIYCAPKAAMAYCSSRVRVSFWIALGRSIGRRARYLSANEEMHRLMVLRPPGIEAYGSRLVRNTGVDRVPTADPLPGCVWKGPGQL